MDKAQSQREVALAELYESLRTMFVDSYHDYLFKSTGLSKPSSFFKYFPDFDGGKNKSTGKVYQPAWPRIVAVGLEKNVSPYDLIRGVFEDPPLASGWTPKPGNFTSDRAVECAIKFKTRHVPALIDHIRRGIKRLTDAISGEIKARKEVGLLKNVDAAVYYVIDYKQENPITNIIVAAQLGVSSILLRHLPAAARVYMSYPKEIHEAFGKLLPDDLFEYLKFVYQYYVASDFACNSLTQNQ